LTKHNCCIDSTVAGEFKEKNSSFPISFRAASIACLTANATQGLKQRGGSPKNKRNGHVGTHEKN
jgi:hypothetical protein